MIKQLKILFTVIILSGCTSVSYLPTDDADPSVHRTDPENIQVFSTNDAGRNYSVIGEVIASADAGENADMTVSLLKKQAAQLGADAIVNLRLSFTMGYWSNGMTAEGTAVSFK